MMLISKAFDILGFYPQQRVKGTDQPSADLSWSVIPPTSEQRIKGTDQPSADLSWSVTPPTSDGESSDDESNEMPPPDKVIGKDIKDLFGEETQTDWCKSR